MIRCLDVSNRMNRLAKGQDRQKFGDDARPASALGHADRQPGYRTAAGGFPTRRSPCWSRVITVVARFRIRLGKKPSSGVFAVVLAGITLLLNGCGDDGIMSRFMLKPDHIIVERRPDPAYDQFFPYYVELCATSQFRSKLKGEGGVAGHAVMYIKGACKDEEAPYPQLRRCHVAATELSDPEHGAGISVGRWFRNINWVATPGYKLFYQGNLNIGEPLTQAHFDATVRDVISKGVYKGVQFHEPPGIAADASLEDFIANEGIGTDLALQFARSAFCARLPITEPMLQEIIAFLNDKNREYAEGDADYNWSVWADNCATPCGTPWLPPNLVAIVGACRETSSTFQSCRACKRVRESGGTGY